MRFVVELYGSAKGCAVIPTISRCLSSRIGDDVCINMDAIENKGYDGFLRINDGSEIFVSQIARGMKNYVQIELPYPWSKHEVRSNVPVRSFCANGYIDSVIHLVKLKIKSAVKGFKKT